MTTHLCHIQQDYEILVRFRSLKHLNITSTPLSNHDLKSLLCVRPHLFSGLHHVFHPLFINAHDSIPHPLTFRIGFGRFGAPGAYCGTHTSHWVPFLTADALVGKFTDILMQITVKLFRDSCVQNFLASIRVVLANGMEALRGPEPEEEWDRRRISTFPREGLPETWMTQGYVFIVRQKEIVEGRRTHWQEVGWEYGMFASRELQGASAQDEEQSPDETGPRKRYVQEVLDFSAFFKRLEAEGRPADQGKVQSLVDMVQVLPTVKLITLERCLSSFKDEDRNVRPLWEY
ncbi:hypothetical protein FA15DRAFT_754396 [Coprinopsis marcescibilis]|uniref:Uncharacterized protein n=1 Tax=Coprinopsis marcescibilis TaxID=230819 RepID=A0A5C3LFJ1_COPMA|nr:hypothetical protein FA15DRAFT_754396 [Coprinopsis marcescibilis]